MSAVEGETVREEVVESGEVSGRGVVEVRGDGETIRSVTRAKPSSGCEKEREQVNWSADVICTGSVESQGSVVFASIAREVKNSELDVSAAPPAFGRGISWIVGMRVSVSVLVVVTIISGQSESRIVVVIIPSTEQVEAVMMQVSVPA